MTLTPVRFQDSEEICEQSVIWGDGLEMNLRGLGNEVGEAEGLSMFFHKPVTLTLWITKTDKTLQEKACELSWLAGSGWPLEELPLIL